MKIIPFFLIFVFSLINSHNVYSQEVGKADIEDLKSRYDWFAEGVKKYKPRKKDIQELEKNGKYLNYLVFAATWCPDTRELLPQFNKTLEEAGIPLEYVDLYLLNESKSSPDQLELLYNISSVPTIIILKNGDEIGRITEKVNNSIEADLLEIISQNLSMDY